MLRTEIGNGLYNASDLIRVEKWCEYLASVLNSLGYNITIITKTDWVQTDMRTASQMERIRTNIKALMNGFYAMHNIENDAENFDYIKANNWEQILYDIWLLETGMQNWFVYSGVANSGQPRLWQHRFREFEEFVISMIWNDFGGDIWNDYQVETWNDLL